MSMEETKNHTKDQRARSGVTLTELLVVISIMIILMAIMASALSAFTHTSRVDSAADTVATAFREARFYAMSKNVSVIPFVLRDMVDGRLTVVYAAKGLHFRGTLNAGDNPPIKYAPAEANKTQNPWTLTLKGVDGEELADGAFVFMVGAATLDLNNLSADQAYYELLQMKITPPANAALLNDSSQYTYEILARGVHNTARGSYSTNTTTATLGVDGYIVVSGSNTGETIKPSEARAYTLTGYSLPDDVMIDQVPSVEEIGDIGPVQATLIAQAGIFQEEGTLLPDGGKHLKPEHFPVFLPIFLPDGRVGSSVGQDLLGGLEMRHFSTVAPFASRTLRIRDIVSREVRYVIVELNGMVQISANLPDGYNLTEGDPGIPGYEEVYDPSGSTASSSSTSSSTSSTTASTSSSASTTSSASSSSSTGTGSTTSSATSSASSSASSNSSTTSSSASSSSSTGTGSTTASSSNSSTSSSNSSTSSSNSSSTSSNSSSTSSSASTSSSTGTGSTTSSASSTSTASTTATSGAITSGGASGGGASSGGTSTGGGLFD